MTRKKIVKACPITSAKTRFDKAYFTFDGFNITVHIASLAEHITKENGCPAMPLKKRIAIDKKIRALPISDPR